jgi:hypothetical protein
MKITGTAEEIARFKQTCTRVVFEGKPPLLDFDAIIPVPDVFREEEAVTLSLTLVRDDDPRRSQIELTRSRFREATGHPIRLSGLLNVGGP